MSQYLFNNDLRNLSLEQQNLINMYVNQYNQTNMHINLLSNMLDEIRENIINIINTTRPRRSRQNNTRNRYSRQLNTNTNTNTRFNRFFDQVNNRENNHIYYDYNNPINPALYNDNFNIPFYNIYRNNNTTTQNNDLLQFLTTFLNSNVVVRPTNEQIQNASRIIRYGDIDGPLSESCPISLDEFNDDDQVRQLLPCGHLFHETQFQEWFQNNVRCPVCRYDIRNYTSSRRNVQNNEQRVESQSAEDTRTPTEDTRTPTEDTRTPTEDTRIPTEDTPTPTEDTRTPTLSNVTYVRDPISNQIEQLTFDITDPHFLNNFVDQMARNVFQSLLNPQTQNTNERYMYDPSNNILLYETLIRPNDNQYNNNNNN